VTEEAVAVEAAAAAAAILRTSDPIGVRHKGTIDLVTEVDLRCEAAIREVLLRHLPDVPVLGEEGGGAADARTRWVVDPLDGTTNFVHGFPFYAVSIGLEVDGVPTVGVVVDVVRDRVYRATVGRGAWLGDVRLHTSDVRSLGQALCGTGFPYDSNKNAAFYLKFVQAFLERTQGIRRAGSASLDLAMVAAGHVDLFWEFGLRRWDVSAGTVLVREAGGRVTPIPGYETADPANPIATNPWLHDEVVALMVRVTNQETE
jgi:myo-inositol-1(or 4)-monophosphatase